MLLAIIIFSTISITLSNTKGSVKTAKKGSKNWPLYITNEVETTYTPYSEWFLMVYIDQMSSFVVSFFKISIICQLDTSNVATLQAKALDPNIHFWLVESLLAKFLTDYLGY